LPLIKPDKNGKLEIKPWTIRARFGSQQTKIAGSVKRAVGEIIDGTLDMEALFHPTVADVKPATLITQAEIEKALTAYTDVACIPTDTTIPDSKGR